MTKVNTRQKKPKRLITQEIIEEFDEDSTAVLANRLDQDDYKNPFEGLNDWHMLRALAIH